MIRAVIFDWGGVFMRLVDPSPRLTWDARLGLAPGSVSRLVFASPAWLRAQLGQISDGDFWADLGTRLNLAPKALAEFQHDFWAGDRLDGDLVALVRSLRARSKTALLSNFSAELRRLLTQYDLIDTFDAIVISGEEGIMKSDTRIYHLAAKRLGVPISGCLFVDDFEENVTGAQAAGMQAIHFVSSSSLVQALSELGVVA
jgi:epoxide hydrolase-like predicted phosphatase